MTATAIILIACIAAEAMGQTEAIRFDHSVDIVAAWAGGHDGPRGSTQAGADGNGKEHTHPPTPRDHVIACPEPSDPAPPRAIVFNMAPDNRWNQNDPESFDTVYFDELREAFGSCEQTNLRIGLSYIFSILETPPEVLKESVRALLCHSKKTNVPVLVNLDGQIWWRSRSDLWNWWDPAKPGYNPENVHNVEWTDWSPESAVKIGWRNWGRQIRVCPEPNILSPRLLQEYRERLEALLPVIMEWYEALPPERKHLLLGVKVGWETSIGVNAFYYPDGNRIYEASPDDPSNDPQEGRRHELGLFGGTVPLGYSALTTGGIRTLGPLTREDLGEAVRRNLAFLSKIVADAGLPRHRVYTHQGGTYAPWEKHMPFWPAFNEHALPGWSFYMVDPAEPKELGETLDERGDPRWAAVEWWWPATTVAGWKENFRRTLSFRDCRFVCVYNWNQGGFKRRPEGIEAVRQLLQAGLIE